MLLCNHAEVREGLLFVNGACVTRVWRKDLPAALDLCVAVVFDVAGHEAGQQHEARLQVLDADGQTVVDAAARFAPGSSPDRQPGEPMQAPAVFDLRQVRLKAFGAYDVPLLLDGVEYHRLSFTLLPTPTPAGQPA